MQVLPIDVAKSRLQVAQPGTAYDVSLVRNIQKLYLESASVMSLLSTITVATHDIAVLEAQYQDP